MPPIAKHAMVAVLDALGARTYTESEIDNFLQSRDVVLGHLAARAVEEFAPGKQEDPGLLPNSRFRLFTFNDTVVIVVLAEDGKHVSLDDVQRFAIRLRYLMYHSLK